MERLIDAFSLPFMRYALGGGLLISVVCSFLSVFVVTRRVVFVGAVLSQMAAAGIALGFVVGISTDLLSLVFVFLGVGVISFISESGRIPGEGVLGVAFGVAWALTIVFLAKSAVGLEEIHFLLYGNIFSITVEDVFLLLGVCALVLLVLAVFYKEILFVSFDPDMARSQGYKTEFWNFLFYLLLSISIALFIKSAGVLLVFSYLVIPGVVGLSLMGTMRRAFVIALVVSLVSTFLGLWMSFELDLPASPMMVVVSFILLILSVVYKVVFEV